MFYTIKNLEVKPKVINEKGLAITYAFFDVDIYDDTDKLITTIRQEINGNSFRSIDEEENKIKIEAQRILDWYNIKSKLEKGKIEVTSQEIASLKVK